MINRIDLQTVNLKTQYSSKTSSNKSFSFDSFINSKLNSNSSVEKQNSQEKDIHEDNSKVHQKYIDKLKDAIASYKKVSDSSDEDDAGNKKSLEQEVMNNNDLAQSKEKLQEALNDVSKMVQDDKTMTKDEISQIKKLLNDIPKDIKEDSSLQSIVSNILQSIGKIQLENSDLVVLVPSSDTNVNSDNQTTDEVKNNKDDSKEPSNEAILETLQGLLAQVQDPNNKISIVKQDTKEKLINSLKSLIDSIQKNPQDTGKLIKDFISKNTNQLVKLLQTSGFDSKEFTDIIDKLKNYNVLDTQELIDNKTTTNSEANTVINDVEPKINSEIKTNENKINTQVKTDINNTESKNIDSTSTTIDTAKVTDSSANSSDSKSGDGSNSSLKEEKVLKSIINGTDNNVVNRFALVNNNNTVQQNAVQNNEQVINQSKMTEGVIQSIKYMSTQGINELIVKINPRELGELVISIVKDGNAMKAELKASNKETYALLMQNSDDLKKYLGEQNIKVSNVDISLTQDSTQSKEGFFFGESRRENQQNLNNSNSNDINQYQEDEDSEEEDLLANINMLV